jgi:hypothetical protein
LAEEVLVGEDVHQVLHRVLEGDPLDLMGRCAAHLRAEGVLVYLTRLVHRAAARVAFDADLLDGSRIDGWLDDCVARSVVELMEEQQSEEWALVPPGESPDAPLYHRVSEAAGIPIALARVAVMAINRCPAAQRRSYHAVVLEGRALAACAHEWDIPPDRVRAQIGEVASAILMALESASPDHRGDSHGS